jgi:hypothetical protein
MTRTELVQRSDDWALYLASRKPRLVKILAGWWAALLALLASAPERVLRRSERGYVGRHHLGEGRWYPLYHVPPHGPRYIVNMP